MPRGAVRCSNAHVLLCTLRFCAAILVSIHLTKSILWKLAMENLSELEKILGYEFKNKHLLQQAVTFVNQHWKELIDKNVAPPKDSKTLLQEVAHSKGLGNPVYEVVGRAGSEHEPTFFMTVSLRGIKSQQGEGRNKKLAEQAAAAKMLDFLGYPHGTKC